jgi:phage baseplate assembly protein W
MDRRTGKRLSGQQHLVMRVQDVLSTMRRTRVMRRAYGSNITDLQDAPISQPVIIEYFAGITDAFYNPINGMQDVSLQKLRVVAVSAGKLTIGIDAVWVPTGERITLNNVMIE